MRQFLIFSIGLLTVITGVSVSSDELLREHPSEVLPQEIFPLTIKPGFHFELTAPQRCDGAAPLIASARRISCRFETQGSKDILLSICDDKKTVCQPVHVGVEVKAGLAAEKSTHATAPSAALKQAQTEIKKKLLPGFEHLSSADLRASHDQRPVFVMVSTDWCGPCNEAKENVLSKDGFIRATADWRRVYVDGDNSVESADWRTYVPFLGYPTFALLTPDLQEVARYGGENRLHDFEAWIAEAKSWYPRSITAVKSDVLARQSGSWMQALRDLVHGVDKEKEKTWLLQWAIAAEDRALLGQFQETDVPLAMRADWLHNQFDAQPELGNAAKAELFGRVVEMEKNREYFTRDLADLCDLDVVACKKWIGELSGRAAWWDKITFASDAEKRAALADEYYYQDQVYQHVGDKERAKQAAEACVQQAEQEAKGSVLKLPRAASINRSYCLQEVGRYDEAEHLLKDLIQTYPNESTFFLRYAKFLWHRQNRLKDAYAMVERAADTGYGYNWITAISLKAEIESAMKNPDAALSTIHQALGELRLSSADPEDREQIWAGRLRDLEQKVMHDRN